MNQKPESIDQYIRDFPGPIQDLLQQIRKTILSAAPEATEAISYAIPTFKLNGNLVHFAAFKNHIGFYPAPTGLKEFEKELAPYAQGKGSVQFPLDQPIPFALIEKIVKHRVQQNLSKPAGKK